MELGFSQTSIELLRQLNAPGWTPPQVVEVARTYRLAVELMPTVLRPSGKHFLHHLVGTASILAWCEQPAVVVKAGLLHAIYEFGDFGTERDPRRIVRERVGPDVEHLVWKYHGVKWTAHLIRDLGSGAVPIESVDREVLIMRLANHLEDHLDQGMLYYPDGARREGHRPALGDDLLTIARYVGIDNLAAALDAAFEQDAGAKILPALRSAHEKVWIEPRPDTMKRPSILLKDVSSKFLYHVKRSLRLGLRRIGV